MDAVLQFPGVSMVSSTALTLIVIPAIYALIKGFGLPQIREGKQELEGTIHAAS